MSTFCGMNCFCRELDAELTTTGVLSAEIQLAIAAQVGVGKHTRLILCGPFGCEIIRVVNKEGQVCIEQRGDEGTAVRAWEKGTQIKFDWTVANMDDWYACKREAETSATDNAPIKSDYFTIIPPETEGDPWCIEPPESSSEDADGPIEFISCGYRFFIKDGRWCRAALPPGETQADGFYSNPDVVIKNGCPVFQKSSNRLAGKCGCCSCGKSEGSEPVKSESEPASDGSAGYWWFKPSSGCVFILCDGIWYGVGTNIVT